jgi:ABC-type nitrate/sulfonate/bicarbonate transport system substrate-binding protein
MQKKHAATLLISPFEVNAEAMGFTRLANAADVLGPYQGLVGAARRAWAKEREKDLVGYIRGYLAALDWLFAPANKSEAVAILRKHLPNMAEELAQKSYDILVHPTSGFARRAELDVAGIGTVLTLRSKYGRPAGQLTDPAKYYDLQYYAKARR